MIRLDMSEFQSISDIPRLIGGSGQEGILTTPVRENPFSLLLLDEIEKAHRNILNLFLQVLDEGHITDGQGRKVVFTNTIIICTSNAGAELIFESVEKKEKIDKQKLLDFYFEKGIFKPEFINRFDAVVLFNPLTKENLLDIAQLMLDSLKKNLKEKNINFIITEELKAKIKELKDILGDEKLILKIIKKDLSELKREFGKDLSFHGSIDIQDTLPHGTVDDVRAEVKQRMVAGKPGGGFIISTAHNIQPDTPVENVIVLFDAYREFGSYE